MSIEYKIIKIQIDEIEVKLNTYLSTLYQVKILAELKTIKRKLFKTYVDNETRWYTLPFVSYGINELKIFLELLLNNGFDIINTRLCTDSEQIEFHHKTFMDCTITVDYNIKYSSKSSFNILDFDCGRYFTTILYVTIPQLKIFNKPYYYSLINGFNDLEYTLSLIQTNNEVNDITIKKSYNLVEQ